MENNNDKLDDFFDELPDISYETFLESLVNGRSVDTEKFQQSQISRFIKKQTENAVDSVEMIIVDTIIREKSTQSKVTNEISMDKKGKNKKYAQIKRNIKELTVRRRRRKKKYCFS